MKLLGYIICGISMLLFPTAIILALKNKPRLAVISNFVETVLAIIGIAILFSTLA